METLKPGTKTKKHSLAAIMKAAEISAPREMKIKPAKIPEPAPAEVRIRLSGCGVCASSVPVWEGRKWFTYPQKTGAPGHEGWGYIDKTGDEAGNFKKGDRVAVLSYQAFAEYDIAPADSVVKLPQEFKSDIFLGEPLGCAMNIFRRSEIQPGQQVAVIGAGFLGSLLIQLAKNAGARVIALSQRPFSLEMAEKMGADCVIPLRDYHKIIRKVKTCTRNNFCERVIEATGTQTALDLAGELTAVRGKLVIAGYHQDGQRQVNMQLWNWRGLDVINAHERETASYMEGIRQAVEAVATGILNPEPLYTHRMPLSELDKAFELLRKRPDGFMKAVMFYE
ncbi:MAG: zinc-binding dehydrogenase [Balneolaceae bacterium]